MRYDVVVIGGGFYGCMIALELAKRHKKILIIEQEAELLQRASFTNQARVHGGYHYPRSLLTALRSLKNFQYFCQDFSLAIKSDFHKIYAIARIGSKTSAKQFFHIFNKMQAPIKPAPPHIKALFCKDLIEDVFMVREYVFDSSVLQRILTERLMDYNVEVRLCSRVQCVQEMTNGILTTLQNGTDIESKAVYNCTYAGINTLLHNSHLPLLSLKSEITEMALIQIPNELENTSITIMDGAFFSMMPFPANLSHAKTLIAPQPIHDQHNLYTLSHVRYTPHTSWLDSQGFHNAYECLDTYPKATRYPYMIHDAVRYVPLLQECHYVGSLFEVKIVRADNESDDGRPIVFMQDYGIKGFANVLGGKIDNIYDILQTLRR